MPAAPSLSPLLPPAPAIVLAAGRGERMRPLTDTCPKPLLHVQGKPLMQYHLEALAHGGFAQAMVNTAWLGEQIERQFGSVFAPLPKQNGDSLLSKTERGTPAVALHYSHEGRDFGGALETAGGIARALPQLAAVFWSMAGDVYAPDFAFTQAAVDRFAASGKLAHLWLVPNPAHHPRGDFGLEAIDAQGVGLCTDPPSDSAAPRYTYSTFALFHQTLFAAPWCDIAPGNPLGVKAPLAPLLRKAMAQGQISAELYTGRWTDVGTPQRLAELNA